MKVLASVRKDPEQATIKVDSKYVTIQEFEIDELALEAVPRGDPYDVRLLFNPVPFSQIKDKEELSKLTQAVISGKYPLPAQRIFLDKLAARPNSAIIRAYFKACNQSACPCPLFASFGCVDFIEAEVPVDNTFTHKPLEILKRKMIGQLLIAMDARFSPAEVSELKNTLRGKEDEQAATFGRFYE